MASTLRRFLKRLSQFALGFWVLTLPFQIELPLFISQWQMAWPNPYLQSPLRVFDLFLLLSAGAFLLESAWTRSQVRSGSAHLFCLLLLFILLSIFSLLFHYPGDALFFTVLLQCTVLLLAYFLLVNRILEMRTLILLFLMTMSFQLVLVLFQVISQANDGTEALATLHFLNRDWLRPYGSFAHPNILASFLLSALLLAAPLIEKRAQKIAFMGPFILALFLSLSRANVLAYLLSFGKKLKWYLLPLLLLFLALLFIRGGFSHESLLDRWEGFQHALQLIAQYPLGLGYLQSTRFYDLALPQNFAPWEYQPVHNVPLLMLIEWGLPLTLLFAIAAFYLLRPILKKFGIFGPIFLALFFVSLWDHHLWTLSQSRELFLFIFALSSRYLCDPDSLLSFFPLKTPSHSEEKSLPSARG